MTRRKQPRTADGALPAEVRPRPRRLDAIDMFGRGAHPLQSLVISDLPVAAESQSNQSGTQALPIAFRHQSVGLFQKQRILEGDGYGVKEAADVDEALLLLDGGDFAAVLTYIEMPGLLNGLDLARMIRAMWPAGGARREKDPILR